MTAFVPDGEGSWSGAADGDSEAPEDEGEGSGDGSPSGHTVSAPFESADPSGTGSKRTKLDSGRTIKGGTAPGVNPASAAACGASMAASFLRTGVEITMCTSDGRCWGLRFPPAVSEGRSGVPPLATPAVTTEEEESAMAPPPGGKWTRRLLGLCIKPCPAAPAAAGSTRLLNVKECRWKAAFVGECLGDGEWPRGLSDGEHCDGERLCPAPSATEVQAGRVGLSPAVGVVASPSTFPALGAFSIQLRPCCTPAGATMAASLVAATVLPPPLT